jgi:hypothetical protein
VLSEHARVLAARPAAPAVPISPRVRRRTWRDFGRYLAVVLAQVFNPSGSALVVDMVAKDDEGFESLVVAHTCYQSTGNKTSCGLSPGQLSELALNEHVPAIDLPPKVEDSRIARLVVAVDGGLTTRSNRDAAKTDLVNQVRDSYLWNVTSFKGETIRDSTRALDEYLRVWSMDQYAAE